jgi:uncharacterized membrane protein
MMDLPAALFSPVLLLLLDLLALGVMAGVLWRVPWRQLSPVALNAWMGASVLVLTLWALRGAVAGGLSIHLLGVAILTLLMGPRLALLAVALLVFSSSLAGHGELTALGLNWLVSGLVPVTVVSLMLRLTQRYLPANFFIYLFLNAFLAGGLSLVAASLAGFALLLAFGSGLPGAQLIDAFPFYLLLSWSEAFVTGLILAILIVYRPLWVASFDDARYLSE